MEMPYTLNVQLIMLLVIILIYSQGMCMCVAVFEKSGVKHIVGGFEDGKVICWDIRNPGRELSYTEMFSEPGLLQMHA